MSINWWTSLVPAPAVTPAPIAYINAAAVEKLVVRSRVGQCKAETVPCEQVPSLGSKAPTHQPYAYGTSANATVSELGSPALRSRPQLGRVLTGSIGTDGVNESVGIEDDQILSWSTTVNNAVSGLRSEPNDFHSTNPWNEKSRIMGSGGSTIARLKLKGIDGMTPQGVELHAHYTDAINESECLLATYLEAGGDSFELASW
eukprot:gene23838-biopygen8897